MEVREEGMEVQEEDMARLFGLQHLKTHFPNLALTKMRN